MAPIHDRMPVVLGIEHVLIVKSVLNLLGDFVKTFGNRNPCEQEGQQRREASKLG
jgi:hypothetical protein